MAFKKRRNRKRGRKLFNGRDPRLIARRLIAAFYRGYNDKDVSAYARISLSAYYRYMRKCRGKKLLHAKKIMRRRLTFEELIKAREDLRNLKLTPLVLDLSRNNDSVISEKSWKRK